VLGWNLDHGGCWTGGASIGESFFDRNDAGGFRNGRAKALEGGLGAADFRIIQRGNRLGSERRIELFLGGSASSFSFISLDTVN